MTIKTFLNSSYILHQPFEPAGDQPTAIAQLMKGGEGRNYFELGPVNLGFLKRFGGVEEK